MLQKNQSDTLLWAKPLTLRGSHVTLMPLSHEHHDDLFEALQDGELWKLWYALIPEPAQLRTEIDRRLALRAQGLMLPFTVFENISGKAVGMTAYLNMDATHHRLEIGGTWYQRRVQRSALNTECKLMLLTDAFESKDCIAVEFRTHFFNHASRRGIERLGAKLDGVIRNHQIAPNGTFRDTCVYSIIASEWPTVKAHLAWEMKKPRE